MFCKFNFRLCLLLAGGVQNSFAMQGGSAAQGGTESSA
jgi:hypothetical protein